MRSVSRCGTSSPFIRCLRTPGFPSPACMAGVTSSTRSLWNSSPAGPTSSMSTKSTVIASSTSTYKFSSGSTSCRSSPLSTLEITVPADGSGMEAMRTQERQWRAAKDWADPFMEFCLWWLHRHEPLSGGRLTPILCDTGQFHHDGRHLLAVLDLEGGHVGDPMMDLAVWRMRDTLIPFGNMDELYARYEELAGDPVDIEAIERHYFASTIGNELMFAAAGSIPPLTPTS